MPRSGGGEGEVEEKGEGEWWGEKGKDKRTQRFFIEISFPKRDKPRVGRISNLRGDFFLFLKICFGFEKSKSAKIPPCRIPGICVGSNTLPPSFPKKEGEMMR